jgi:hypothetical protein
MYACSTQLTDRPMHPRPVTGGMTRRIALAMRGRIACNSVLRCSGTRKRSSRIRSGKRYSEQMTSRHISRPLVTPEACNMRQSCNAPLDSISHIPISGLIGTWPNHDENSVTLDGGKQAVRDCGNEIRPDWSRPLGNRLFLRP